MPSLTIVASGDSWMNGHLQDYNYGAYTVVDHGAVYFGGTKNLLGRPIGNFDVSALAGAAVDAAKMQRNISYAAGSFAAKMYRCTRPATWTESGVTWNKYDGVNAWTAGGGDFDAVTPAPVAFTEPVAQGLHEILGLEDFVRDALDNRSGVLSVILHADNETPGTTQYVQFRSREYSVGAERWRLVVDYSFVDLGRRREGGPAGGRERQPRRPLAPQAARQARRPRSWWVGR